MDPEEFRAILSRSRAGIWALIEAAINVAGSDYGDELRRRRDKLVELLYAPEAHKCQDCSGRDVVAHEPYFPENISNNYNTSSENLDNNSIKYDEDEDDDENKKFNNDSNNNRDSHDDFAKSPESNNRNLSGGEEGEDGDLYSDLFDDEQTKIFTIKEQLEDLNQSEDTVVELLQSLADMDITFQALKETDIGRHVNRLRKHSSNEVCRLVKQLVRKWKETVNDWAKVNQPQATSNLIADGDSPQQSIITKNQQSGHHQVPDFGYSPNPQNGSSTVERKYAEHEPKTKPPQSAARREAPLRPPQSVPKSTSAPPNRASQKLSAMDDEKLNSARKRLQENYQEAQNAKKQRKIQVMDIHDIPKPKNAFFVKNKGNLPGRYHR